MCSLMVCMACLTKPSKPQPATTKLIRNLNFHLIYVTFIKCLRYKKKQNKHNTGLQMKTFFFLRVVFNLIRDSSRFWDALSEYVNHFCTARQDFEQFAFL